jgi:sugar/nucleoside kinase (ribokinase family)
VEGQDRRYLHVSGANQAYTAKHLDLEWLAELELFYLGGLFAMGGLALAEFGEVLRFCRERHVLTVVDVVVPRNAPNIEGLAPLLPYIDYFLPNDSEAGLITGFTDTYDQLRALRAKGANTVIITQGAKGSIAMRGDAFWQCGAYQLEAVDPSGSGDAFASGIITGVLRGWDMPRTLSYGSALGASVTRGVGTTETIFSASEAKQFLATHRITVAEGKF